MDPSHRDSAAASGAQDLKAQNIEQAGHCCRKELGNALPVGNAQSSQGKPESGQDGIRALQAESYHALGAGPSVEADPEHWHGLPPDEHVPSGVKPETTASARDKVVWTNPRDWAEKKRPPVGGATICAEDGDRRRGPLASSRGHAADRAQWAATPPMPAGRSRAARRSKTLRAHSAPPSRTLACCARPAHESARHACEGECGAASCARHPTLTVPQPDPSRCKADVSVFAQPRAADTEPPKPLPGLLCCHGVRTQGAGQESRRRSGQSSRNTRFACCSRRTRESWAAAGLTTPLDRRSGDDARALPMTTP